MRRRATPEVQAGSMADIAFLLLIFFLVTTTIEKDKGIARQLPPAVQEKTQVIVKNKNLLEIIINTEDELLVENEPTAIKDLQKTVIDFLDNGGIAKGVDGYCDYCRGSRDPLSSDNPQKAVISIAPDRLTSYETYIKVQNELTKAYTVLRSREARDLYNINYVRVDKMIKEGTFEELSDKRKMQIKVVKERYPMLISEAETKNELRL